jgi:hypothetical protein
MPRRRQARLVRIGGMCLASEELAVALTARVGRGPHQ